ncbi:hypothetical protein B0O80DRAFT_437141 [Mortierella sp. GBAus27b]|nr:hypothetical protein B0O80DRAFT_437141 [Mortierella sp. GBAus27b]
MPCCPVVLLIPLALFCATTTQWLRRNERHATVFNACRSAQPCRTMLCPCHAMPCAQAHAHIQRNTRQRACPLGECAAFSHPSLALPPILQKRKTDSWKEQQPTPRETTQTRLPFFHKHIIHMRI